MFIPIKIKGMVLDVLVSPKGKNYANIYSSGEMYRVFMDEKEVKSFKKGETVEVDCTLIVDKPYFKVS